MRRSVYLGVLFGLVSSLCSSAQITGGHETEQDAIRFERQKQAAADRQERIEKRGGENSTAERAVTGTNKTNRMRPRKKQSGAAARTAPSEQSEQKKQQ